MSSSPVFLRVGSPLSAFQPFTGNPSAMRRLIMRYTHGECMVLACRIHELTGWPIMQLMDQPTRPMPVHYANRRFDGGLVDITGRYPPKLDMLAIQGHDCANPVWTAGAYIPLERNDRRRAKTVLDSPWGFYLVPLAERR